MCLFYNTFSRKFVVFFIISISVFPVNSNNKNSYEPIIKKQKNWFNIEKIGIAKTKTNKRVTSKQLTFILDYKEKTISKERLKIKRLPRSTIYSETMGLSSGFLPPTQVIRRAKTENIVEIVGTKFKLKC